LELTIPLREGKGVVQVLVTLQEAATLISLKKAARSAGRLFFCITPRVGAR
jgi:hypothetical protein